MIVCPKPGKGDRELSYTVQYLLEGNAVKIDLNMPMKDMLATLSKYPVATRLSLTGTIVVGRDIAHAKLKELLDAGKPLPQYVKDQYVIKKKF